MTADQLNMTLVLYRGITVEPSEAESIREQILNDGLSVDSSKNWGAFHCIDLRPRLNKLLQKDNLATDETRPSRWVKTARGGYSEPIGHYPAFCACGDELGASYYALKHNANERDGRIVPLLIKFRSLVRDVQVDGRDLLYTAMQCGSSAEHEQNLTRVFGKKVVAYFEHARASDNQDYRVALCDLAIQDPEIVLSHYSNDIVLGGQCGTIFKSAFLVRSPVSSEQIISVTTPSMREFTPQLTLREFRQST
jgi:hypothetical protein